MRGSKCKRLRSLARIITYRGGPDFVPTERQVYRELKKINSRGGT